MGAKLENVGPSEIDFIISRGLRYASRVNGNMGKMGKLGCPFDFAQDRLARLLGITGKGMLRPVELSLEFLI